MDLVFLSTLFTFFIAIVALVSGCSRLSGKDVSARKKS